MSANDESGHCDLKAEMAQTTRYKHPCAHTAYALARYARQHAEAIDAANIQVPTDWHAND